MDHLTTGKIEPRESFYLYAKIRSDQSATLLNSINTNVDRSTLFFLCMNKMQDKNKNLFYFSCDPEDYLVNRHGYCRGNGVVEFFYKSVKNAIVGTHHLTFKNNLQHTTGYVRDKTFSKLEDTFSSPPGVEIKFTPSKEYDIPQQMHQGPAYNINIDNKEVNFYFRKNTTQTGVKNTFEALVNLPSASPKFISLNRSYLKLTTSDYSSTDSGIRITTAANADKVNRYGSGILKDSADNYFEYKIIKNSKDVQIIGTSKFNSTTSDTAIDKTGDIYFIQSSDFDNSFINLETLVGDGYSNKTQYLDFFLLKKNSYGSGANKYISFGYNTASATNNFYSSVKGTLINSQSYGCLIHFISAYIDTTNLPVNNYASLKVAPSNNNPSLPHKLHSNLHESTLELDYNYSKTNMVNFTELSTQDGSTHGPKTTIQSVEGSNNNGQIFYFTPEQYQYNQTLDYIFIGFLAIPSIILLCVILIYLLKLFEKEDKEDKEEKEEKG